MPLYVTSAVGLHRSASASCPLYPAKRTWFGMVEISAPCS